MTDNVEKNMKYPVARAAAACWPTRRPLLSQGAFERNFNKHRSYSQRSESDDPLRILFCGTDSFSLTSLEALHEYSREPGSHIASIDVVTRTDKRVGRGRKLILPPPIKAPAQQRGMTVHQIDTFTGWKPPLFGDGGDEPCNLVIAVSFGLLIPPRILGAAKYGGLNIHPSMLPDLRGPAPIEWAIILGRRTTGISLQTLHPSRFDEGTILDQTPPPGLDIANSDGITLPKLKNYLAPLGAKMLVDAIKQRLYIPPVRPIQPDQQISTHNLVHAPKITKEFRGVDFGALTAQEILRRSRACGPLHAFARIPGKNEMTLIKLNAVMRAVQDGDIPAVAEAAAEVIPHGVPYAIVKTSDNVSESNLPLIVNARKETSGKSRAVVIPSVVVAGMAGAPGARAAARAKLFASETPYGDFKLFCFSEPMVSHEPPLEEVDNSRQTP